MTMIKNNLFLSLLFCAFVFTQNTKAQNYSHLDSLNYYLNNENKRLSLKEKSDVYFKLGSFHNSLNNADEVLPYLNKAIDGYEKLGLEKDIAKTNYLIFNLIQSQNKLNLKSKPYLDKVYHYAIKSRDTLYLSKSYSGYAKLAFNKTDFLIAKKYYLMLLELSKASKNKKKKSATYSNIGLLYSGFIRQDSARYYFGKALEYTEANKLILYINYANSYQKENNHIKALEYLELAKQLPIKKYKKGYLKILYGKMANSYYKTNQYKKAYESFNLYNKYKDSINVTKQNANIAETEAKYQNEKLRANNLEIEAKRIETRNWLIGVVITLLFTGITAYSINKNTKRKQLLAVKEKELETQKVSTLLKEQELTSIDAMIAGQEKERQRIANDLHDDLGALIATIKLHINALENGNLQPLSQVNLLINEVYNKIRGMAHSRNAGVMAQDGVLKALNKVANTINQSKQLQISVISHGLENRLENSLELSIFRMIQELVTNIIKHAQATEATIHLTKHEESLNIMVEDNGIGFNTQIISQKDGMGIHNIDKRIEHLNGSIDIESAPEQGTSVIIDIPL